MAGLLISHLLLDADKTWRFGDNAGKGLPLDKELRGPTRDKGDFLRRISRRFLFDDGSPKSMRTSPRLV